jgi:hypothetical protein
MKLRFKESRVIDGFEFVKGGVYTLPDWIARSFISQGLAVVPGLKTLGDVHEEAPIEEKKPAEKPAKKRKPARTAPKPRKG